MGYFIWRCPKISLHPEDVKRCGQGCDGEHGLYKRGYGSEDVAVGIGWGLNLSSKSAKGNQDLKRGLGYAWNVGNRDESVMLNFH
jgi:hypothetical protein